MGTKNRTRQRFCKKYELARSTSFQGSITEHRRVRPHPTIHLRAGPDRTFRDLGTQKANYKLLVFMQCTQQNLEIGKSNEGSCHMCHMCTVAVFTVAVIFAATVGLFI